MPQSTLRGVSLIGPMGAGKTTVGRILSQRLTRAFIDIDELIEMNAGREVAQIFREDGEESFRDLEEMAVIEATRSIGSVLSCGGGVVLRRTNIERLQAHGQIAYLQIPAQVASDRIRETESRPLLGQDPSVELSRMIQAREHLYLDASDVIVDAAAPVEEVITQLLAVLSE